MADAEVPHFWELDYTGDFRLYQHPPCMFVLWWLGLAVNAGWEAVKKLIDEYFGDGSDSGGGEGKGDKEKGEGDEGEEGEEGDGGDGGEEEEEGGDEGGDDNAEEEADKPPEEEEAEA